MIRREAEWSMAAVPEPIKDLIWDDEDGFFENAFRWGGRGLFFIAPGPIAIMHTVAGMMGIGLSELGQVLDEKIAGKPLTQSNLVKLANEIADALLPKLEARAASFDTGIVSFAADPGQKPAGSKITFEGAKPRVPAPVLLDPEQPVPEKSKAKSPAPVELPPLPSEKPTKEKPAESKKSEKSKKAPTLKELDPIGFERARMEIRDEFKQKEHARRLEHAQLSLKDQMALREIDAAQARTALEHKKELDAHHAKMENEKFLRDRGAMEHQIRTKYEIESRFMKEKELLDLDRQLILGKITPAQHKLLYSSISGQPISNKDLAKAQKEMTRSERTELKKRLEARSAEQQRDLAHKEKLNKVELRNAKLMAAARGGNKGLLSAFKMGVGKAGLVAAIVAILFAGLQMIGRGSVSQPDSLGQAGAGELIKSPVSEKPSAPDISRVRVAPDKIAPAAKPGRNKSLSKHINNELDSILGG